MCLAVIHQPIGRCVGPKDAPTARLHPASSAATDYLEFRQSQSCWVNAITWLRYPIVVTSRIWILFWSFNLGRTLTSPKTRQWRTMATNSIVIHGIMVVNASIDIYTVVGNYVLRMSNWKMASQPFIFEASLCAHTFIQPGPNQVCTTNGNIANHLKTRVLNWMQINKMVQNPNHWQMYAAVVFQARRPSLSSLGLWSRLDITTVSHVSGRPLTGALLQWKQPRPQQAR